MVPRKPQTALLNSTISCWEDNPEEKWKEMKVGEKTLYVQLHYVWVLLLQPTLYDVSTKYVSFWSNV